MTTPLWSDLPLPAAPEVTALDGDARADVVVVGLGASGLAAAEEAARLGADVLAIDAEGLAAGAAGRNGGLLMVGGARFHHDAIAVWGRERAERVLGLTAEERDRQVAELPGIVRRTGSLRVAGDDEEERDVLAQHDAMRAAGLDVALVDGERTTLSVPGDAACNPAARVRAMAARAGAAGVRFAATGAIGALGDDGPSVVTEGGTIRADHVLVCIDGDLEHVVPALAGRVRTTRLQMLAFAAEGGACPVPVYARWGYEYAQQLPDGRIVAGGMRDRFVDDEWDAPAEPSTTLQTELEAWARAAFGTSAPVTHRWAGRVSYTASKLSVCGQVGDVWVAGAYSGMGNVLGVLAGRGIARAALSGDRDLVDALGGPETIG
jgi:glycine/D-amino acid oxidase-like deaminating enzyme